MKLVKVILLLFFFQGILIPPSYIHAQSQKQKLIGMLRQYVGMVKYGEETFFIDEINNLASAEIRFKSHEKFADPTKLIFDVSRLDISSIRLNRAVNTQDGLFKHFEIKAKGSGVIYSPNPYGDSRSYSSIEIYLAGIELFTPTTDDIDIAKNLLALLKGAAKEAQSIPRGTLAKTFSINNEEKLVKELLEAETFTFKANNHSGGYLTIQGGLKEFIGKVKTVCLSIETEIEKDDIHPDVSVNLVFIMLRTYRGKRETVGEITSVFPSQTEDNTCCKTCLRYPESDIFLSGAYEVFIYIGKDQERKMGNFMFAVR